MTHLLLPHRYKYIGLGLLVPSLIFLYMFAYRGIKPDFLDVNVFAVWSKYFETKYFTVIENNISEEITLVFLLISLCFIAFARVSEENEATMQMRFKALLLATYINTALLILSVFFVYGIAFVSIVFMNIVSALLLYIIIFNVYYYRSLR
jgi:hypothetical protein